MCRVLYSSLEFTVELSLSFCFVPEAMKNRLMRLPPGFCWNHCRVLTVEEKLHLRVQFAPSCRFRTEGLCSTFTALTPAWEEKNKHIWCLGRVMDAVSRPETISGNTHEDVGPYRSSRVSSPSLLPQLHSRTTQTHSKAGPTEAPARLPATASWLLAQLLGYLCPHSGERRVLGPEKFSSYCQIVPVLLELTSITENRSHMNCHSPNRKFHPQPPREIVQ